MFSAHFFLLLAFSKKFSKSNYSWGVNNFLDCKRCREGESSKFYNPEDDVVTIGVEITAVGSIGADIDSVLSESNMNA